MAVNAFFTADFSSFYAAVQKADVKLKEFESGAVDVTTKLNKMTDAFSGRRIIQDATLMAEIFQRAGGTAAFTTAELQRMGAVGSEAVEKMRALGKDVPPGIQKIADQAKGLNTVMGRDMLGTLTKVAGAFGIAFSIQTLTRFAGNLFNTASAAHDLALKLSVSAEAAQRYSFAAKQTSATTEDVGRAISFMNRELSQGDKSTVKALRDAGLEFSAIRAMRPEDAFEAIATAIKGIADPMLQAELATKLFSRAGNDLLPGIKEGFVEIGNSATVMSNKTVDSLERAQDAWEALGNKVVTVSGNLLATTIDTTSHITSSWKSFFDFVGNVMQFGTGGAAALAALSAAAQTTRGDITLLAAPGQLRQTADELKAVEDAAKKAAEAQEKYAESLRDIVDVLSGGGAIDKATLYMQALDRTVDVTQMAADKQKILHNVLDDALVVYARLGEVAPKAMRDAWLATAPLVPLSSDYARTLGTVHQQLELIATDSGQWFLGLADGTRTVLEHTITWRDTLADVVNVLGVVGDKWSTVAQGILRQSQAIVALWQGGKRTAAVGQAIGGAAQLIPTGTTAGSVASGAAQGAAVGSVFGPAGLAVGAGVGALIGWYQSGKAARQVNDARDAFLAQNGELDKLHKHLVATLGPMGEFLTQQLLAADTMAEFTAAEQGITAALEKHADRLAEVQAMVEGLSKSFGDIVDGSHLSAESIEDLGIIGLASYNAMIEAGYSEADALRMNHGWIAKLRKAYEDLGVDVENTALDLIFLQDQILTNNPALLTAIGGLSSSLDALNNMGMLNADTFAAMERTGADMYTRLQAEAAAAGGTTKDALGPMQSFLHEAEEAAKELGIPLDDNTQMLIDQSKELGIWKDKGKDANDILLEGLQKLVDKMDDLIDRLNNIPNPDFTVTGTYIPPDIPDVNGMATGGFGRVTRPTLFLAGEAGAEDFAFSGAGRRFGGGAGGRGGGTVILEMERRRVAEWLVPELPGAIARYGLLN